MPIPQTVKRCLDEMKITKEIPVYSTAFLKSPVIVGILKPRIYLPIPLFLILKKPRCAICCFTNCSTTDTMTFLSII